MNNKRDKQELVITRGELRQLLFWASIGVNSSRGGSYSNTISMVIVDWATQLNLKIPYNLQYPEWKKVEKK